MISVYLIGSLRNPKVSEIAVRLREQGLEVFDDWSSPGPETDEFWQKYEKQRGRTYAQALQGYHAREVFDFDKTHLDRADVVVLILPAGKSGHLELGYIIGKGKPGFILLDGEPERYDVMYLFATGIFNNEEEMVAKLKEISNAEQRSVHAGI